MEFHSTSRVSRALSSAGLAALLSCIPVAASAVDSTWIGGTGTNWSTAANWDSGFPCGAGGIARFSGGPLPSVLDTGCVLNRLVFSGADGWTVQNANSAVIFMFGPGAAIDADVGATIQADVSLNSVTTITTTGLGLQVQGALTAPETSGLIKLGAGTLTVDGMLLAPAVDVAAGQITVGSANIYSLVGAGTFASSGNIGLGIDGASSVFEGVLQTSTSLIKSGAGTIELRGSTTTGFAAIVADGVLMLGNATTGSVDVTALHVIAPGSVVVNVPGAAAIDSISSTGTFSFLGGSVTSSGSWMPDAGSSVTISGGSVNAATVIALGSFSVVAPATLTVPTAAFASLEGSGIVTVSSSLEVGADGVSSSFTGTLNGGGAFFKEGDGTFTAGGLGFASTVVQEGTLAINAGTIEGPVTVQNGATLEINAGTIQGLVVVQGGATFAGSALVNGNLTVQSGGVVRPTSTVSIVSGDLFLAGALQVPVNGNSPGTGYGQLVVAGSAFPSGSLALSGAYVPVLGDQLVLISNDAADPIGGTFSGMPEGFTFPFNGVVMRLSYAGGDGNDVTVSSVAHTVTPSVSSIHVGSISPDTPQTVLSGQAASFTITSLFPYHVESVGGTCGGSLVGNTFTTDPVTANCTVIAIFALDTFTISVSGGANGTITPVTNTTVEYGGSRQFTVTPDAGYTAVVNGTCGGNLVGATYTTDAITANCTVSATFTQITFTVTPSAGANGTISPSTPQTVVQGATAVFTVTPSTGYTAVVNGTCGGNLVGTTYTTSAIAADCSVSATFTQITYTVTPSAGAGGTMSPGTPQTVAHGATTSFTVTPNATFEIESVSGCGGALAGNTFTTGVITASCTVTAAFSASNPPRLGNISTRMQVLTGNDVMIGGFVIGGATNKTVAIVATGPSLAAFGITNPLANPTLRLVRSSDQATLATNDDWQAAANSAQLTAEGFAPTNALEAAILVSLAPGAYTAIVEGVGGGTGVAVIGVYEVDGPTIPLVNISTRGRVLTGNDVMIGGFVIQGSGSQTVAIVATGPSLAAFGITSPLANPTISLVRSSDQAVLATNDDWQTDPNAAQLTTAGFAPTNPLESGIYTTLPPGAYTVIVQGVGGGTGVAVIGVYRAGP